MSKGRAFFLLILVGVLGWVTYAYLLPSMGIELGADANRADDGFAAFEKGRYDNAAKALGHEVARGRDTSRVLLYLGRSLKETGRSDEASTHLNSLITKYPSSPETAEALYLLGEMASGPPQKIKWWMRLLEEAYDSPWAGTAAVPAGDMLAASGNLFAARGAYSRTLLDGNLSGSEQLRIKAALTDMNKILAFSPSPTPDSSVYTVKAGDDLDKIARAHKTTAGFIKMINKLDSNMIFPEQELKIINSPVRILVERNFFRLTVFLGTHWLKEYRVSIGMDEKTPIGVFAAKDKLINPDWFRPGKPTIPYGDERNILGTRWIGISKRGYGIHGTTMPDSIGKATTQGCVRMRNADVEEVFEFVTPGVEIEIR